MEAGRPWHAAHNHGEVHHEPQEASGTAFRAKTYTSARPIFPRTRVSPAPAAPRGKSVPNTDHMHMQVLSIQGTTACLSTSVEWRHARRERGGLAASATSHRYILYLRTTSLSLLARDGHLSCAAASSCADNWCQHGRRSLHSTWARQPRVPLPHRVPLAGARGSSGALGQGAARRCFGTGHAARPG